METIGPCTFSQLPEHYQELFKSGQAHQRARRFLPYKSDGCVIPMLIFLGIPFLVIALSVVVIGGRALVNNPDVVAQVLQDAVSSWKTFFLLLVIILMLVGGMMGMLAIGWQSVADALVWFRMRGARGSGAQYYGLRLDRENLVIRHGDHGDEYTCAFIPRSAMTECFVDKIRVEGAKHARYIDVVKIWYKDDTLKEWEMVLKEHFDTPAKEMRAMIQSWRAGKTGGGRQGK